MTFQQGLRAIVVDASVAVDVVSESGGWSARVQQWIEQDALLLAPPEFRHEVANAFLKGQRQAPAIIAIRLQRLFDTGVDIADRGLDGLIESVVLADKHRLTVYDAAYLQLALDCEAEIATQDQALGRAAAAEGLVVHA
jgi:predicted nucleic acid-binding protein